MYRLLIVDDEKTERDCVRFLVDGFSLELEIREAADGAEALALLRTWPADILCTDVQMPVLNGLDLSRKAEALLPELKIIIFSGFAEFEYARTAVSLGVENYILKPIVPDELESTLRAVVRTLDEARDSRAQADIHDTYQLLFALQQAINGNEEPLRRSPALLEKASAFARLALLHFPGAFLENSYLAFYDALRKGLSLDFEMLNLSPEQALLFVRGAKPDAAAFGTSLHEYVRFRFQADCCVAVSGPLAAGYTLKDAFTEVDQLMERRFWATEDRVFTGQAQKAAPAVGAGYSDSAQLVLIRDALAAKDGEALQKNLEEVFARYRIPANQSQIFVKFVFSNLVTTLYPSLPPDAAGSRPVLDDLILEVYMQADIEKIIESVQQMAGRITAGFAAQNAGVRREVAAVQEYIQKNYGRDLSVETLAATVYLTPDYLSRLFKKTTGQSLSQYLRQVRMEQACALLLHTGKKVIDVGSAVGYPNYSYFCQSFREYYGKSPEKYRQEARTWNG